MRTITTTHADGLQYIDVLPCGSETITDLVNRFIKQLDRLFLIFSL